MFGLGELPKGYNPKVHGPYDPAIYYGPRDKAFGEVKLGELPAWLSRRGKSPIDWGRAVSRVYWRWSHKYFLPKVGCSSIANVSFALRPLYYIIYTTEK